MSRLAVLVTDRRVLPARRGNQVRILGVLRGLRALGWRVALICPPHAGGDDVRSEVDEVYRIRARSFDGGDVGGFDSRPFRWAVQRVVAARRPRVVIAEYAWLAPALSRLPRSATRVIDCHDVLHERTSRFDAAGLDPWVRCTRAQERDLLSSADLLLTGQLRDRDILRALLPDKDVACVFPSIEATAGPSAPPESTRALAVGASHAGNDGILRFAERAWPAVLEAVPDARLDVVGSLTAGPPAPGITFVGEVDDLAGWYRSAAVVLCPLEVGTGVKIKMIEALRHGKAIVATPAAVEGLPPADDPAWVQVTDLGECAQAAARLLSRPDERARLELRAAGYADRHFAPASIRRDLDAALAGIRPARRWLTQAVAR